MGFFSEYRQFNKLVQVHHPVVFYAESQHYYQYFRQLITDLLQQTSLPVLYITSDVNDPLLSTSSERLQVVYVKRFFPGKSETRKMSGEESHQIIVAPVFHQ